MDNDIQDLVKRQIGDDLGLATTKYLFEEITDELKSEIKRVACDVINGRRFDGKIIICVGRHSILSTKWVANELVVEVLR